MSTHGAALRFRWSLTGARRQRRNASLRLVALVSMTLVLAGYPSEPAWGAARQTPPAHHPRASRSARITPHSHPGGGGSNCQSITGGTVGYWGGVVGSTPTAYVIFWGSGWNSNSDQETAVTSVTSTFGSLAGSSYQAELQPYCVKAESGENALSGVYYDTSTPPSYVSPTTAASEVVTDDALAGWPGPNTGNIFLIYVPPGVSTIAACGYHGSYNNFVYAVLPWPSDSYEQGGCDQNGVSTAVRLTVASSHEYVEAATDPFTSCTNTGGSDYIDGAFVNYPTPCGPAQEVGDLCEPTAGNLSYTSTLPGDVSNLAEQSTVQLIWIDSSTGGACRGELTQGYWSEHTPGGSTSKFGNASTESCNSGDPCPSGSTAVHGLAQAPFSDLQGYFETDPAGDVFTFGYGANYRGDLAGRHLNQPVRGIAVTPDGAGYWLVAGDGGIFAFGDAKYHGSCPQIGCNVTDIVGMASTPDGGGYWLVGSDGGVFTFGNARYYGSQAGNIQCPVVGMSATPEANAYWLVDQCANVYPFDGYYNGFVQGVASIYASPPPGYEDIQGITPTLEGLGYYIWSSGGNIWSEGDALWYGSDASCHCDTEGGFAESI